MAILTAKPEPRNAVQWNGEAPLLIMMPFGLVSLVPGGWIAERPNSSGELSIALYSKEYWADHLAVAPDQPTEAPTPVAKVKPVEVAEVESAMYWAVVRRGEIAEYFAHLVVRECREHAEALADDFNRKISSLAEQYTVAPLFFSPVAKPKPDIAGEVWVLVNKATREPVYFTYASREEAESRAAMLPSNKWETVQLA